MVPKIVTKHPVTLILTLLGVGLLSSFGWSLRAPTFIAHEGSILRLPLLSCWKNVPLMFSRDFLMFSDGQFRPLSYALLAVVRTVVGVEEVVFWHLWLLVFHGLNAVLVFVLIRHFSRHIWSAVLAAFLFAVHPLGSEVVNHVGSFHYVLSLTFYLGALNGYVSFSDTGRKGWYAGAVGLFLLGVFTSKVVFTLPLVLGAYELWYRRGSLSPSAGRGGRSLLWRLLPFAVLPVLLSPLWWFYKPHPFYYVYSDFPYGAGWYSFFSIVGTTGWYVRGLLLGCDLPVVLYEVSERIFRFTHWRFLVWGGLDLGIVVAAGWSLRRKWWGGLGVVMLFGAMIPFASTTWNKVEEYVSWAYLYIPLAGLAFLVGGVADTLWSSLRRGVRVGSSVVLGLVVLGYGIQQVRLNLTSRSAVRYWEHVLQLNPNSEIAHVELGKAELSQGEIGKALGVLFSPAMKQLHGSCLAMSSYYCAQGDYLSSAIHLGMAGHQETGLRYQDYERVASELLYAAGALDYAQEALGRSLMANPYNVSAMERLAKIWVRKGYVNAAERLALRGSEIAPSHPDVNRMWVIIHARRNAGGTSEVPEVVHPPKPDWLRYVTEGVRNIPLQEKIIQVSEVHPDDPVIQMEAGICLVKGGQPERALPKLAVVTRSLSSYSYAWAMRCWAAAEAGAYEEAENAGRRALDLDPKNPVVHNVLGLLFSNLSERPRDRGPADQSAVHRAIGHYQQALRLNPNNAVVHNNLGNLLDEQGKSEEAIEHYRQALRLKPDYAKAHNNLGIALAQQEKLDEAIEHYHQALNIRPEYAEAHNNLGIALAQQGKAKEAIAHFQDVLRIKPNYTTTWDNLGMLLMKGRREAGEAIRVLREARIYAPDHPGVAINLAYLLATCPEPHLRNGAEAVQLAERVCQTTEYKDPQALDILAAAYAEAGRFAEAVQTAQQALQIVRSSGSSQLEEQLEARLNLYKTHRAYHRGRGK